MNRMEGVLEMPLVLLDINIEGEFLRICLSESR